MVDHDVRRLLEKDGVWLVAHIFVQYNLHHQTVNVFIILGASQLSIVHLKKMWRKCWRISRFNIQLLKVGRYLKSVSVMSMCESETVYLTPGVRLETSLRLIFLTNLQTETITSKSVEHLKVRLLDLHHVPDLVVSFHLVLAVLHPPVTVHQELVIVFALPGIVYVDPVILPLRFGHLDTPPGRHGPCQVDVVRSRVLTVPEYVYIRIEALYHIEGLYCLKFPSILTYLYQYLH